MKYEILDVIGLAKNYAALGWVVVCDGDTKRAHTAGLRSRKMRNKNEVFEYLIDQLRQQVNNNQCEDLAHEVQSLKNQLRDVSAQIKELHKALATTTGDVEAYKIIRKGDTPGCKHNWLRSKHRTGFFCSDCGARKEDVRLPVCQCVPAHCGTYHGNTLVCDNCGGVIPE